MSTRLATPPRQRPAFRPRAIVSAIAGLYGGGLAFAFMSRPGFYADFLAWWFAARALIRGVDPYSVVPNQAPYFISDPLVYPLPTVLTVVPFSWMPLVLAGALFVGLSAALLAWALTRDGYDRLPIFASFPFVMAASLGQWAPLVTAAALLPGAGFLAVCKPTLAAAFALSRLTRGIILGGAAFLLGSLLIEPQWPARWLANLGHAAPHPAPLFTLAGVACALALLRWRREDARLVFGMAAVPQLAMFADQLPLLTVARTRVEAMALALLSHLGGLAWLLTRDPKNHPAWDGTNLMLASVYLPALILVLRRPNEGEFPSWLLALRRRVSATRAPTA
jgi:hypothetical protein